MAQEQVKALKEKVVADLHDKVGENLDKYFSDSSDSDVDFFHPDEDVRILLSVQCDLEPLKKLEPASGGDNDIENALLVYQSFPDLTPYKACDERIWTHLTHGPCFSYTQKRWLYGKEGSSPDAKVKLVQKHFFARVDGSRGWQRNNAISNLWWSAHIARKCGEENFEKTLKVLLHQTDFRKSIVERPSTSQSAKVLSVIMKVLTDIYYNGDLDFFRRGVGRGAYLEFARFINRHGGTRFLEALSEKDLRNLIEQLVSDARDEVSAA